MKAEHRPLWHLTGAAHIEGLNHSAETIGCHGYNVLPIGVHLSFHDDLRVQQRGELWHRAGVVGLPLFEKQRGYLAAGRGGGWVLPVPVQLCGDEHQPLIERVPQQLQRLQRDRGSERHRVKDKANGMIHDRSDFDLPGGCTFYNASFTVLGPFSFYLGLQI